MPAINTLQDLIDSGKVIGLDALQEQKTNLLRDIQGKLRQIGAYGGDLDGLYGPITERALILFCQAVYLDTMQTQLLGPTFATKLLQAPPPVFPAGQGKPTGFRAPVGGVVTSEFGNRVHPVTGELRLHKGIDIGGNAGQAVVASATGTVVIAGVVSGYGNFVEISHGDGLTSAYAHLARIDVRQGATIRQGEPLGVVGATGGVTGPHLHFEIFHNGLPQNPRDYVSFA
ncbi:MULTISPECIES: M23 family metallopeptidase [Aphanothece]|uniref:M23 family metallopeptidase n=1 Tax=Aphanothece TaxID=1121 RepID=UPI0039847B0D